MSSPSPHVGPQARFFDALAAHRFELPQCIACDARHFPPRAICPSCAGTAFRWSPASGRGVVHSATTVRRKAADGGDYGVCLIDLEEGPRLMSCVDGVAPDRVRIGMAVVARLKAGDGGSLRVSFEPANAGAAHG
jgi:uncharacterized OB-fold protein